MSKMPAAKKLNRRHDLIAAVVNEWFQTLPYPHNQMPRHTLIADLNGCVEELLEASYTVAKQDGETS